MLKSIMEVIKTTNGDVGDHSRAKVKEIESLDIGRDAVGQKGSISTASAAGGAAAPTAADAYEGAGAAAAGSDAVGPPPGGAGGGYDQAYGEGGPGAGPIIIDPQENRYVNKAYEPIPAMELQEMASTASGDTAYLAVAKRMPVRMRFKMDYRHINRLLVECANSRLPIEVKQLRFNPPKEATVYGGGGFGAAYGGYGEGGGGYGEGAGGYGAGGSGYGEGPTGGGDAAGGGYESSYGGGGADNPYGSMMRPGFGGNRLGKSSIKMSSNFDRPVEIYGIIYIFNPVDKSKIGEEDTEAAGDEDFPDDTTQDDPADII